MRREDQEQFEPIIPDRLAADLRHLTNIETNAPEVFEDELLSLARHRLGRSNRLRIHARRAAPLAAAAGLALTVGVGLWAINGQRPTPGPMIDRAAQIAMDIDGNGRIDILDAFVIARAIESGSLLSSTWDVTADGVVDLRDVDAVAAAAVSLTESSRS